MRKVDNRDVKRKLRNEINSKAKNQEVQIFGYERGVAAYSRPDIPDSGHTACCRV